MGIEVTLPEPLTQLEAALMLTQEIIDLGPHAHEKEIFDAVYHFLEYLDEVAEQELDEEIEYELTPAGQIVADEAYPGDFSADMRDEFHDFSPNVGTFEGTAELADLVGRNRLAALEYNIDRDVVMDPTINRPVMRAPVAERTYHWGGLGIDPQGPDGSFSAAKVIEELFTPCGAD